MSLLKKGTCETSIVISSAVYACEKCGHIEVVKGDDDMMTPKECPKCQSIMKLISSQAGLAETTEPAIIAE